MPTNKLKTLLASLLLGTACITVCITAFADTRLKIITQTGALAFTVDDDWAVLNMQSKLPVAAAVFQLPNPADRQTADSTNLILKFYDLITDAGRTAYDVPVKQYGSSSPKTENLDAWTIFRQEALQGATRYTILDARRDQVADSANIAVTARLAWPHLKSNAKKYDALMEARFRKFLHSVQSELGPYKQQENEVIRRPAQ
ncbi:hypothetical protein [Undibacterium sp. TC9W]|uniref:hypothetical protein n=1 Tax=Undibacterium sp. TC9W TaxID=3413053 RepID=UPI003BF3C31A